MAIPRQPGLTADDVEELIDGRIANRLTSEDVASLIDGRIKDYVTAEDATKIADSAAAMRMGSAEIWKVVEGRLTERLQLLKALIYVVSAIVVFFSGVIVWFVSDSEIRDRLVSKWILDIPSQFNRDSLVEPFNKFLDKPSVAAKFHNMFDTQFNATMKNIVAYSYSSVFYLGTKPGSKSYHYLPFYRTADDEGKLECTASYPEPTKTDKNDDEPVRNKLSLKWNDTGAKEVFVFDEDNPRVARLSIFMPDRPDHIFGDRGTIADRQRATFRIKDTPKFDKSVEVSCTRMIIGPVKFHDTIARQPTHN